jgi:hypothetical protein
MKPVVIALLCCIFLCTAASGEITFTLPKAEYFVPVGGTTEIAIFSENTGGDISGTLTRFENRTFIGKDGLPESVRKKESGLYLVSEGPSCITISPGSSEVTATSVLTIVFEYSDPVSRAITLDGPVIHFVSEVSSSPYETDPLQSRETSPAQAGSAGSAGQAGDRENAKPQPANGEQAPVVRSLPDDAVSLGSFISVENERYEQDKKNLTQILEADPLYTEAGRSLSGKGYSLESKNIVPDSNESGTFRCEYRAWNRLPADMSGQVSGGRVSYLLMSGPGGDIIPGVLEKNATFLGYNSILTSEGLHLNSTSVSAVPGKNIITVLYAGTPENTAAVTAVSINGTLQAVILDRPERENEFLIVLTGFIAMCALAVGGFMLYRRNRNVRAGTAAEDTGFCPVQESSLDNGAQILLTQSMDAYHSGDIRKAYEYAGRALRNHISCRYGTGTEITGFDAICTLTNSGIRSQVAESILEMCCLVAFAGYPGDPDEFIYIIHQIEDFLSVREVVSAAVCTGNSGEEGKI